MSNSTKKYSNKQTLLRQRDKLFIRENNLKKGSVLELCNLKKKMNNLNFKIVDIDDTYENELLGEFQCINV